MSTGKDGSGELSGSRIAASSSNSTISAVNPGQSLRITFDNPDDNLVRQHALDRHMMHPLDLLHARSNVFHIDCKNIGIAPGVQLDAAQDLGILHMLQPADRDPLYIESRIGMQVPSTRPTPPMPHNQAR